MISKSLVIATFVSRKYFGVSVTLKRVKEIKETNSCNLTTRVFCGCVCSSIMLRGGETRTVARYFCMRSHRLMSRTSCHLHCLLMFNYANAAIASLKQFEIFYEYLYLATSMSVMSHYHKLLIRSTKLIEYVCMSF